jgi:predicted nuclease of predicted toxin-antitoxin system
VRLLIDEMYPPAIAERLRQAGYDAVSVHDAVPAHTGGLRGSDDSAICAFALSAGRAVVTENAADFLRLLKDRMAVGEPAPALVITSNKSFPRHSASFTGHAVRALRAFCDAHPAPAAPPGAVYWLRPSAGEDVG